MEEFSDDVCQCRFCRADLIFSLGGRVLAYTYKEIEDSMNREYSFFVRWLDRKIFGTPSQYRAFTIPLISKK